MKRVTIMRISLIILTIVFFNAQTSQAFRIKFRGSGGVVIENGSITKICPEKSKAICAEFECEGLWGTISCIIMKISYSTPPASHTPPGLGFSNAMQGTLTIYSPDHAPQSIPVQVVQPGSLIRM